jgi:hypothetical protein
VADQVEVACRRCGSLTCADKCPVWNLQTDTKCGNAFVGRSICGRPYLFVTDEEHDVVMIRLEDAHAVAMALLELCGEVPRA